jgi:WXG100 family type VII secretion target
VAADGTLRIDPAVMAGFAQSLSGAVGYLQSRLKELDGHVGEMLGGWEGSAGGAYSSAWQQWHRGASEVHLGLSTLAKLVGQAGVEYGRNESVSAEALRFVDDG